MKLLIFFISALMLYTAQIEYTPLELLSEDSQTIQVEVRGNINNPGLFTLQAPATFEALIQQLDLKEDSFLDNYSYQKILMDEEIIVIPSVKESQNLISINSASIKELMMLPGIKETLAERIIQYRQINGGFKSLEELMEVKGIGQAKFNKVREYICL